MDDDERQALGTIFWDPFGWAVSLDEHRQYPDYGEWDWTARTNNSGLLALHLDRAWPSI